MRHTIAQALPGTAAAAVDAAQPRRLRSGADQAHALPSNIRPRGARIAPLTETEWKQFVAAGTRTGKLATTRLDGRPHVVPVWFVLDGDDLVFNTGAATVKGRSLTRTGSTSLCVDDERPPFSFVTVSGPVAISTDLDEMLPMGDANRRAMHGRGARRAVWAPQRRRRRAARSPAGRARRGGQQPRRVSPRAPAAAGQAS
jgi:PPOX class probable F420-dependent enzyme